MRRSTARHASAHRKGQCERGGGGTHSSFRLGQSTAAGSAASSVLSASLRADRAAAPGGSGPPRTRAGRPRRQPCARAARPTADDRQRRRGRIQRRAARPQRPAQQRTAANAHGVQAAGANAQGLQELALAEPLGERLHLRGGDDPAAHHVRVRPAPAAQRWTEVGTNGPKPWKVTAHALNTHSRARDRPTDAFGAATVP